MLGNVTAIPGVEPDWFVRAVHIGGRDELIASVVSRAEEPARLQEVIEQRLRDRLGVRILSTSIGGRIGGIVRAVDANTLRIQDVDVPDHHLRAACLEALSERERSVVIASLFQEESIDSPGLSPGNIRVIRHRALGKLRACMEIA